jgi:penicillin-insensitive murein endopeptidase
MKNQILRPFFLICSCALILTACSAQEEPTQSSVETKSTQKPTNPVDSLMKLYANTSVKSQSLGTVSNGSLKNSALFPFSGPNFRYFDTSSYLSKRAFLNASVLKSVLECYKTLETSLNGRIFGVMECSHEHGGKLTPHRTHQNGLSIDFMTPLLFNGQLNHDLDTLGAAHYFMQFDDRGYYTVDPRYRIDFETMAQHIYTLYQIAKANGHPIEKVIWKLELQDELLATKYGKLLLKENVNFTKHFKPLINNLHDDHYHIDFQNTK